MIACSHSVNAYSASTVSLRMNAPGEADLDLHLFGGIIADARDLELALARRVLDARR